MEREELSRFGENCTCFFRIPSFSTSVYRTNDRFVRRCFPEKTGGRQQYSLDQFTRFGLEQINTTPRCRAAYNEVKVIF